MPKNGKLRRGAQGYWVLLFGLTVVISLFGSVKAELITLGNSASDNAVNFDVLRSNQTGTDFSVLVNSINSEPITVNSESYSILSIPDQSMTYEPGKPYLPKIVKLVAIPATGNVELQVHAGNATIIDGVKIPPAQSDEIGDVIDSGRNLYFDDACYAQNAFYPDKLAEMSEPMIARDLRVVAVVMYPVQCNPITHQLKIYSDLTVSVKHTGGVGINEKQTLSRRLSHTMMPFYRDEVLNFDYLGLDDPDPIPGTLLIICANDASVLSEVNKIADWKRKKGFNTVIATLSQTGSSASQIKTYIQNMYNNVNQNPPLEYVMFVGDGSGSWSVPAGPTGTESDYSYSLLAGSDNIAEIAVGRLSFSTINELQIIRKKIIKYESDPLMGGSNPDWFQDSWMYAGTSHGTSTIFTMQYVRQLLLNAGFNDMEVSTHSSHVDETTINNHVNPGLVIWNHRPNYISEIYCSDVDALNNGWMMPVCLNLTCGTGNWVSGTSISECLLREGTVSQPQGAIAAIATATSGTHTDYNNSFDGSFFHALISMHQYNVGYTLAAGKAHFLFQWMNESYATNFVYWNNLMGDPTLEVWTNTPLSMVASFPDTIAVGTNQITVTVRNMFSQPVEGALVQAYKPNQTFIGEVTGPSGIVTLPITATTVDTLFITATKHEYKPVVRYALVRNMARNIAPVAVTIDDDTLGFSQGNNNGTPDPSESLELSVTLKNWGSQAANGVSATISCTDPHVISFGDTTVTYGNIASGAQVTPTGKFGVVLSPTIPDNYSIELMLNITDNYPSTYQSVVVLPINEINLEHVSHTWLACGNGVFDPGETANLSITLRNQGHRDAPAGISATAVVNRNGITVPDAIGTWSSIAQGAQATNSGDLFQLWASNDLFPGTPFQVTLYLQNASGFRDTVTFNDTLGTPGLHDPLGPDAYGYYAFDNGDTSYIKCPTYSWVEIDQGHGGSGTALSIPDYAVNQDAAVLVNLPFTVQYYGQTFSTISVCSNGFFAFGNQTSNAYPQNWRIPGALGAMSQVSTFWDDFYLTSSGDGRVWKKSDAVNHRFIIEWSRVHNIGSGAIETFEAIIYDKNYYPTPTNDAEILFQYLSITNGDYSNQYGSVGIDNQDQIIGLEYTYWNQYPASAAHLAAGRAILFTTDPGYSLSPPEINVEPSSISADVELGDSTQTYLYIHNEGESNLTYSITLTFGSHAGEIDGQGGPDNYGYIWMDSDEPGGPVYTWEEIGPTPGNPAIGINTGITRDNETVGPFSLGFPMNYYGMTYNSVRICSNGWLSFTDTSTAYSNVSIPNTDPPNAMIAPFWDNLYPPSSGRVFYYPDPINQRFIVQWDTIRNYSGGGRYTFEAILNASGQIYFQYQNLYLAVNGATVGIENPTGTNGLQVAYNQDYLHNEMAIAFFKSWLSSSPTSGIVEPGGTDSLRLMLNASEVWANTFQASVNISNTDPENGLVIVPVTFTVHSPFPPMPVNDLVIAKHGNDIVLSWTPVTQNTNGEPIIVSEYLIHSSSDPHFTPSLTNQIGSTSDSTYVHSNALISNSLRFYLVIAKQ